MVFPPGAARLANTNSFAAATVFNSITYLGSNYVVTGNAITANQRMRAADTGVTESLWNGAPHPVAVQWRRLEVVS